LRKTGALPCADRQIKTAVSQQDCTADAVGDRNRKRCLTQHHGKIASALPVADILTSGKEGKGAVMGADALFFCGQDAPSGA